jgi:hypothetical protein
VAAAEPSAPEAPPTPTPGTRAAPARGIRYRRGSVRPAAPVSGVPMVGIVEVEGSAPEEPEKPKARPRRRSARGIPGRRRAKKKPEEPTSEP